MNDETAAEPTDALWSRLRVIEGQALPERAAAYSALHDELSRRLDSGPKAPASEG